MTSEFAEPAGHRDGVFGLARKDGRVLLVRNGRVARGGLASWWDLPGGSTRPGETLPEALVREWREETGLAAEVRDLFLVADGVKRRPEGPVLYTWRAFFFRVRSDGAPEPGPGIDAAAWVPEAELDARLQAPYHAALRAWLAGDRTVLGRIEWVEPAPEGGAPAGLPRDLLVIAACAAAGDQRTLAAQVERALEAGEDGARIAEALLQVVPYAGYPRAITAFATARPLLGPAPADAATKEESGEAVFERVYGDTAPQVRGGLERLHPALAAWTLEHAYGEVLARGPVLDLRERELLAVSILTALGGLEDPLLGHMRAALRLGASRDDVAGAVQVVPASAGELRRDAARALLGRL